MKRTIILLNLAILIVLASCSPRTKVTSSQNLKDTGKLSEAVETIEQAIDPNQEKADKTLTWPKTWEVRGEIYQAIYQSEDESVKKLSEDPLTEAFESYKKALDLDEKDRFANSVKVKLTLLSNDLTNQAVEAFNEENYEKALKSFEQILAINEMDVIKQDNPEAVDTVIIFNAGLAAYNSQNYDKAVEYYEEAAKHGYNGARTYSLIANAHQLNKDTVAALESLQEGFEKYPNNNDILTSMIQLYLDMEQTEEAMKYLDMAIKQDPNNATFHFAQGTLHEKVENKEKAIEAYKKAIEIDSDMFNANYNLGALYYNEGVEQIEFANTIPTSENERYQEELAKADKWFKLALPYMEKCHEIQPDDNMTMESLKNLYYRLKMMDKYNEMLEKLGQS
ncbi:Tetratricopeptide repeat-containing protein [Tangfeifania diversioriginum]|uniref:Tetratricopeptide repeat-containing protein n=1 Tax=Tangfeifania diversioriginum TaxID=1168035 RepID=A0A1M6CY56_9BACT|nr:tetratricopeptide repeat protein [Tangfeifania diversioriginum]SHI65927.1 Tetratricopeptide repeat-containing protein [Tangfeifania diversioriginum]